jgi:hypothetical protein
VAIPDVTGALATRPAAVVESETSVAGDTTSTGAHETKVALSIARMSSDELRPARTADEDRMCAVSIRTADSHRCL